MALKKISATKDGDFFTSKNSGGLFLGIVFVLLLTAILALILWIGSLANESQSYTKRLLILEEQLQLADSTSTDFLSDINTQLQFFDKEIRKLWDLSNKRNKVNIAKLTQDLAKQSRLLKEIAVTQTNDQKNINAIKLQTKKLQSLISELSKSNEQNIEIKNKISELDKSILLLEETVQAFDSYRIQNNELLQELQLQLLALKEQREPN